MPKQLYVGHESLPCRRKLVLLSLIALDWLRHPCLSIPYYKYWKTTCSEVEQDISSPGNSTNVFKLPDQERKKSFYMRLVVTISVTRLPSLLYNHQASSKPSIRVCDDNEDSSVQNMLLSDILWTLGHMCAVCSHNTTSFRANLESVLLASTHALLRNHSSLLVRRAGIICSYMCIDAWGLQRKQAHQHSVDRCSTSPKHELPA